MFPTTCPTRQIGAINHMTRKGQRGDGAVMVVAPDSKPSMS
jgi:hypothetical protein